MGVRSRILGVAAAAGLVLLTQTAASGAGASLKSAVHASDGWSYVSAGALPTRVKTAAPGAPNDISAGERGAATTSASCYRSSCNGKDPIATGCSQTTSTASYRDYLWDSYDHTYLQVWSRWSSLCQTNWPRSAFSGDISGTDLDAFAQYGTGAPNSTRWDFQATIYGASADLVWGNMLDGGAGTPCITAWGTVGGYIGEADPTGCV